MTATIDSVQERIANGAAHRRLFEQVLKQCIDAQGIDLNCELLVIGASNDDTSALRRLGFRRMTLSNLDEEMGKFDRPESDVKIVTADVEDMPLADGSYDLVLAHAVLHHCRSPHRALLEMLRVSRKHVILLEPNDSLAMRTFVRLRFSFPYEVSAVVGNGFTLGGVQNSCVPNYIFRWSPRDLYQTTASFLAESEFSLYMRRYWDFNVRKRDLELRSETRIGIFMKILGPDLFLAGLRCFQMLANLLPVCAGQGNKFFGCITKHNVLKPWLKHEGGGIAFNRDYAGRS